MKVVIAPDSFKECLRAPDVAAALAEGVLAAAVDAQIDLCPMADGGEGTVGAMVAATGGSTRTADVFDPLGKPVRAHWGLLGTSRAAGLPGELGFSGAMGRMEGAEPAGAGPRRGVVEMAAASGLGLVPPQMRDPLRTTTYGTGQLLLAAVDDGCEEIVVGIGGSATVDGGCGAAQALGVRFLDADGQECIRGLAGGGLADIAEIDLSGRDPRLNDVRLRIACDVMNPLTGAEGAARVYAPQKGATPEVVRGLENALERLAALIHGVTGQDVGTLPGGGAAGGLGAGLVAFAGATLERGANLVAEAVGLRQRLAGADLCVTGEGRLDAQTGSGKTAFAVARICREEGVPVVCVPGRADDGAPDAFDAVLPLAAGEVDEREALRNPTHWLAQRAAEAVAGGRWPG